MLGPCVNPDIIEIVHLCCSSTILEVLGEISCVGEEHFLLVFSCDFVLLDRLFCICHSEPVSTSILSSKAPAGPGRFATWGVGITLT